MAREMRSETIKLGLRLQPSVKEQDNDEYDRKRDDDPGHWHLG
jgi:hypothetical protein